MASKKSNTPKDPLKDRPKVSLKNASIAKNGQDEIIKTETYKGAPRKYNRKEIKKVNHIAGCYSPNMSGGARGGGMGDVVNSMPSFYDPYFEPSSLLLPRDTREVNSWCRYFYKYDPLVATAIDAHSELPLSKIRLQPPKSSEKEYSQMILEFFEDMIGNEGIDLFNKLLQMGVEYYKLGNVFPYLQLNDEGTRWEKLILLDPDFVNVQKITLTDAMIIELIPNQQLKEMVGQGRIYADDRVRILYESIAPEIRDLVQSGKNIPLATDLSKSHVSHIARKMSDYDLFGTSLIERNFKALVYKDRLRQSQDAIAARHLTPKHLIWGADVNNVDVDVIRDQVDQAMNDPDYAIITNFELHWDLVGTSAGLMQLSGEWEWINEELYIGLMINKSFLLGEGAFANGQTVLEILEQRYAIFRETLEQWVEHHVFKPISKANGFTEKKRAFIKNKETGKIERKEVEVVLYPKIKWNRLNLSDDNSHKQMLSQMLERGFLDAGTWLEYFGLDADVIMDKIKHYKDTPLDANYQDMQRNFQSEIGRILAPAIASEKAKDLGLEMYNEKGQQFEGDNGFGMKKVASIEDLPVTAQNFYTRLVNALTDDIMNKIANDNKEAETREERRTDRKVQQQRHKQKNILDGLEPKEKTKVLPPRKDLEGVPDLFKEAKDEYEDFKDIEIIDEDDIVKKKNRTINMEDSLKFSPQKVEMIL